MGYQKVFNKPYEEGYKNLPDKSTPVTAEILNMQDNTFSNIEDYLETFTTGMPDSPLYQLLQNSIPQVNPEMEGNEEVLTGLQVGESKYRIPNYDDKLETTHTTTEKTIEDASDGNIVALSLFGATTQGANPSPSNPQPINGFDGRMGTHDDNGNESTIHTFPLYSIGDVKDELRVFADGSGELIKRIGSIDLGELDDWFYEPGSKTFRTETIPNMLNATNNIYCVKYNTFSYSASSSSMTDKTVKTHNNLDVNRLYIRDDSFNNVEAFKSSMQGVYLYYELATPTTRTLTPSEVAEILKLKTFKSKTYIDAENVEFELEYFADSEIGQTMADIKSTFLNLLLQPTPTNSEQE